MRAEREGRRDAGVSPRRGARVAILRVVIAAGAAAIPAPSRAESLPARDDAFTLPAGGWSVGVWHPARCGVTDRVELRAHPLLFFVAPHVDARVRLATVGGWQVAADGGLAFPSLAMRLLQGHLFPSFDRGGGTMGWVLVPQLGALASRGDPRSRVLTLRVDLAAGVPLVAPAARPLGAPAPLEILFAPVLAGYRARAGALYDARLSPRWRARGYADVFLHGIDEDATRVGFHARLTFRAGGGLDLAVGKASRLVLGVVIWNSFQHARDAAGRDVRSTDPLPVIDFIWSG